MEITLLLKSILGLVVVLAILIFLLFSPFSKKKEKVEPKKTAPVQQRPSNTDLEYLVSIIKNKKSTTKELKEALELIIKYHGTVHKRLGLRTHPDFDIYMGIIFKICGHPNTNKVIIIKFDKEFLRLNPGYKQEINEAMTKGLNSRRV